MSKVMEMLKEKGIVERLQHSVNSVTSLNGGNVPQEDIDKSIGMILCLELERNPDLGDAFAEYAHDLAMKQLVKELGIKYDPESEAAKNPSREERMRHAVAETVAKILCPF